MHSKRIPSHTIIGIQKTENQNVFARKEGANVINEAINLVRFFFF